MTFRFVLVLSTMLTTVAAAHDDHRAGNPRGYEPDALLDVFKVTPADSDVAFDALMQACPAPDCIPSIDEPAFVAPESVDYLRDDDLLLTLTHNGLTRAYPTRILDHHEIVNDLFGTDPVAITYCPLCGSGLAFERRLGERVLAFGVSSLLHNSDLVMYDRQTDSLWQQITGRAVAGKLRGEQLVSLPVSMVTWADWRRRYPGGEVLTVGSVRAPRYMKEAYGDYAESDRLYMPVSATDARLHPKKVIYGVEIGDRSVAVDADWLARKRRWTAGYEGGELSLAIDEAGELRATFAGQVITAHRMYWFAWYSFHPATALVGGD